MDFTNQSNPFQDANGAAGNPAMPTPPPMPNFGPGGTQPAQTQQSAGSTTGGQDPVVVQPQVVNPFQPTPPVTEFVAPQPVVQEVPAAPVTEYTAPAPQPVEPMPTYDPFAAAPVPTQPQPTQPQYEQPMAQNPYGMPAGGQPMQAPAPVQPQYDPMMGQQTQYEQPMAQNPYGMPAGGQPMQAPAPVQPQYDPMMGQQPQYGQPMAQNPYGMPAGGQPMQAPAPVQPQYDPMMGQQPQYGQQMAQNPYGMPAGGQPVQPQYGQPMAQQNPYMGMPPVQQGQPMSPAMGSQTGGSATGDDDEDKTPANFQVGKDLPATISVPVGEHALTFDEQYFLRLLAGSISLSRAEKKRIIDSIPKLKQSQIDELINIFEDEKEKFAELPKKHTAELDRLAKKHLEEWLDIEAEYKSVGQKEEEAAKAEEIRKQLGI